MTSVDCKLCRENIHSYVRGYLSLEERQRFKEHLESCLECRREVEQEQKLTDIMNGWEVVKVSKAFDVNLTTRLTEEKNRCPKQSWFKRFFASN
ncbi:zf-HC2 domain-containing protein [bacterium]|nr:zf-HC2 domain-containing protein [bacterium]